MARKFLVIRFGSLGDVVLTSPVILNLRLSIPSCSITFLTRDRFRPVVEMFDGLDDIVTISNNAGFSELSDLVLGLDDRSFDTIIDLHGNIRSWLIRRMTAAHHKLSYPKRRQARFQLTRTHHIPTSWPHTIDLYNEAIVQAGGKAYCDRPLLFPSISEDRNETPPAAKCVVIAPGARHPNKQWPIERFAQTAAKIHREHEAHILWTVTGDDDVKLDLSTYLPTSHFTRLIERPVSELASTIARADITIANDSGIAHLSSAVGTPTLAIFGPTHPALGFAPRGVLDEVIEVGESCRPCSLHGKKKCWREQRFCMTNITPDDVTARARDLLTRYKPEGKALLLDRDGTVMANKHYLADPEGVQLEATVLEALTIAQNHGWKLIIISNQSGIARGLVTVEQVERVNARLLQMLTAQGVRIDGVLYCPHHPTEAKLTEYAVDCRCRKPRPGMAEDAARKYGINLRRSVVIGDHRDDYLMGRSVGARALVVRTGYGRETEEDLMRQGLPTNGVVFPNLLAAVNTLLGSG